MIASGGGAAGGIAASNGGWYSGIKNYLDNRTLSNIEAGHNAAALTLTLHKVCVFRPSRSL